MWDDRWDLTDINGPFVTYDPERGDWRYVHTDDVLKNESPKPVDDAQARKLKVARFAHVPADCLEIKTETREA